MDRALLEDFVLHLEAVRGKYPAGIAIPPSSSIPAQSDSAEALDARMQYQGPAKAELLFLYIRADDEAARRAEEELLAAAIRKGLQRPLEEIGRLAAAADTETAQVAAAVEARGPRIVALLGDGAAKLLPAAGEVRLVQTCGLAEMLAEPAKKKQCWLDLKGIMAALGWRAS